MSELNEVLGPETVVIIQEDGKDKEYTLSPISLDVERDFCTWMRARVRQEIIKDRLMLAEEDYHGALAAFYERCAGGRYDWPSVFWFEILKRREGRVKLLALLLKADKPRMGERAIGKLWDDHTEEFRRAMDESLGWADVDPTAPAK